MNIIVSKTDETLRISINNKTIYFSSFKNRFYIYSYYTTNVNYTSYKSVVGMSWVVEPPF